MARTFLNKNNDRKKKIVFLIKFKPKRELLKFSHKFKRLYVLGKTSNFPAWYSNK